MILSLFGSPDPRQIDGLGGADLLTSKLAIIDPSTRPDADLDYTFAQVSITEPVVDYDINCGNISAAVGAYAVDEALVAIERTCHNGANPQHQHRQSAAGRGADRRTERPPSRVRTRFTVFPEPAPRSRSTSAQTGGGITGALLPTGNPCDLVETSIGPIEITIVDLANLTVFFTAESVGMTGTEAPGDFSDELLDRVSAVKEAAAMLLGMPADGLTPVPAIVSPPARYVSFATGDPIESEDVDLVARVIGGRPPVRPQGVSGDPRRLHRCRRPYPWHHRPPGHPTGTGRPGRDSDRSPEWCDVGVGLGNSRSRDLER